MNKLKNFMKIGLHFNFVNSLFYKALKEANGMAVLFFDLYKQTIMLIKENTNKNTYLSMRGTHMSTGITKMYRLAQSGRSMVEMLGVLAIVGVLSIGGIMGYDYAVAKFRANTIMSELNLRAVPISQQLTQYPEEANTALTLEAGDTLSSGQSVSANVAVNPEYFEFHLTEVDDTTCELVLGNYETPAWMMVNGNLYENSTDICSNPDNDMTFVYKNDLGERRNCSSKGFFNLETYKCDCAGGTYFNKDAKDCACPAGYIWSEAERKCIESRCQEGEFEALEGGCVSCEDPENIHFLDGAEETIALCNACGNRFASDYQTCIRKDACGIGELFYPLSSDCSSCYLEVKAQLTATHPTAIDQCNACPNRHYAFIGGGAYCVLDEPCSAEEFFGIHTERGCFSCDTPSDIVIGSVDHPNDFAREKEACLACKNADGSSKRTVIDDGKHYICHKIACSDGEFRNISGSCTDCNTQSAVKINVTDSGCEKATCNRTVIEKDGSYYCQKSTCTGDVVRTADGGCFECDQTEAFKATKTECDMCGDKRAWMSSGYCRLKNCVKGQSYPYSGGREHSTLCYSCSGLGDGAARCGTSDYGVEYCEACGNYVDEDGYCVVSDSCTRGVQFRAAISEVANAGYKFCTSCDYVEAVKIGKHPQHRDMCTSCVTTPRFFADNYCYRCDSAKTPVVETQEEKESCLKCSNRFIDEASQCVPVKTEQ